MKYLIILAGLTIVAIGTFSIDALKEKHSQPHVCVYDGDAGATDSKSKIKDTSPRSPLYRYDTTFCDTRMILQNAGCRSCFMVSFDRKLGEPKWVNDVPGCHVSFQQSPYTHVFWIDETFDANKCVNQIKSMAEKRLCKL